MAQLDYLFKKVIENKVKTDSSLAGGTVLDPANERLFTSSLVKPENIWLQTTPLLAGASTAVTAGVAELRDRIKMTSVHGVGASAGFTTLVGRAWKVDSNIENWIDASYHVDFSPTFYVGPTLTSGSPTDPISLSQTIATNSPGFPFTFDYKTGILTFLGAISTFPVNLSVLNAGGPPYVTTHSIWIKGYTYKGLTLASTNPNAVLTATGAAGPQGLTGPQGATGVSGTQGSTGASGATGPSGTQGATGVSGTQGSTGASGATGPSGTQGATGVSGTQGSTGASGATGPSGTQGATGVSGTQGSTGASGATGPSGTQGATGVSGTQGSTGASGATGPSGTQGATGVSGTQGSTGASGATGPSGTQGATGVSGTQGSTGASGATGPSGTQGATGVSGTQGNTGASGATGPSGTQGATGVSGTQGSTGASGATGPSGTQGATGVSGTQGSTGASGATGPSGTQGATGVQGLQGATGPSGVQGIIGVGATGATGASGAQGATGPEGLAFMTLTNFNGGTNAVLSSPSSISVISSGGTSTLFITNQTVNTQTAGIVAQYSVSNNFYTGSNKLFVIQIQLATDQSGSQSNSYGLAINNNGTTTIAEFRSTNSGGTVTVVETVSNVVAGSTFEIRTTPTNVIYRITAPSGTATINGSQTLIHGTYHMMPRCFGNDYTINNIRFYGVVYGLQGVTGPSGAQGLTGPQGVTGVSGAQGLQGVTGPSGAQGLQGATGAGVSTDLINNIGINAYISYATATFVYNQTNRTIAYAVTLFGNSKFYDITFTYSAGFPGLSGGTPHATTVNNTSNIIYNNKPVSPPTTNLQVNYTGTFANVIPAGSHTITITVSTANAGGVGTGSSYVVNYAISIDDIGDPTISFSDPTITQGTPVVISGITYYGTGTTVSYAARAFTLTNIYKVNSNYTLPNPGFNYITITSGVTLSNSTTNLEYISTAPSTYSDFPAGSGVNATYFNKIPVVLSLNNTNVSENTASGSQITRVLRNAIDYTTSGNLHSTSKQIGYINAWSAPTLEINIPIKVSPANPRTIDGITSQTRMSFPNSQANPLTPTSFIDFNNATLTQYDPAYNPFNGRLYASDLATLLNGTYLLPSVASFTSGTKYLVIKAAAQSRLRAFTLNLAGSTNIEEVYVRWEGANWGTATWYNAKVGWQSAGGASTSTPTATSFPITINTDDYNYNATGGGNIYINIRFTGIILMNQIVIS